MKDIFEILFKHYQKQGNDETVYPNIEEFLKKPKVIQYACDSTSNCSFDCDDCILGSANIKSLVKGLTSYIIDKVDYDLFEDSHLSVKNKVFDLIEKNDGKVLKAGNACTNCQYTGCFNCLGNSELEPKILESWYRDEKFKRLNEKPQIKKSNVPKKGKVKNTKQNGEKMKNVKEMFSGLSDNFTFRKLEDETAMGIDGKTYYKRKNGDFVRYDFETAKVINTHSMKMDFSMSMVIPTNQVVAKDVILNNDDFVVVTEVTANKIKGVSLNSGRTRNIVVETSVFGMNFYSKVVNMLENGAGGDTTNPMGNMMSNPMMMMMMMGDDKGETGEGGKMDSMMEMMMMTQMMGGGANANPFGQMGMTQPTAVEKVPTLEELGKEKERLELLAEIENLKGQLKTDTEK